MFTVKAIIGNETNLTQDKEVLIGRPGSSLYDDALRVAGNPGFVVDVVLWTPDSREEGESDSAFVEDSKLVVERTADVEELMPIAVVFNSTPHLVNGEQMTSDIEYKFVYKGDEVYVTDSNGKTVETVR